MLVPANHFICLCLPLRIWSVIFSFIYIIFLEISKWISKNDFEKNTQNRNHILIFDTIITDAKIEQGFEEMMWANEEMVCANTAGKGELKTLQRLLDNGFHWNSKNCTNAAARGGHLHILEWLEKHHCLWGWPHKDDDNKCFCRTHIDDPFLLIPDYPFINDETCLLAAIGGHHKVLEWLIVRGFFYEKEAFNDALEKI